MPEVHGIIEPPEGYEWHVDESATDYANQVLRVIARRKWEPTNLKFGDAVCNRAGEKLYFVADISPLVPSEDTPLCFTDPNGVIVWTYTDGQQYSNEDDSDIIGPWIDEDEEPAEEPQWSPPEWAKGLGWMTQDHNYSMVVFWNIEPEFHEPWKQWCRGRITGIEVNGSLSVAIAKAFNLYPPDWDTLPASERCVFLGDSK